MTWKIAYIRWPWYTRACTAPRIWRASTLPSMRSTLAKDILSSHESPGGPVHLKSELEPVIMSADMAVLCGLILNELISNALKHGFSERCWAARSRLTLRNGPEGKCSLSVEDNGVGIPADLDVNTKQVAGIEASAVLDPADSRFVRLGQNRIGNLGLFAFHGGSSCTLTLISSGPRALIVEDEILIAEELRERLSRFGYSVIAAVDTADEGIAIATRERPDLVLMDIRLRGEKDGVQAAAGDPPAGGRADCLCDRLFRPADRGTG